MLSVLHWISAQRRLTEAQKTVYMLGGTQYNESEVPNQILAQRDMIKLERDYYRDRALDFFFIALFLSIIGCLLYFILYVLPTFR